MAPLEVPDDAQEGFLAPVTSSERAKDAMGGGRIDVEAVSSCLAELSLLSSAVTASTSSIVAPTSGSRASPLTPTPQAPASVDILAKRRAHLAPNTAIFFPEEPLHVVRGRGAELFDAEGHSYLDCEPDSGLLDSLLPFCMRILSAFLTPCQYRFQYF
jgi:hypothetical protein